MGDIEPISDPITVKNRDDVPYERVRRRLQPEQFDALRQHHESIDGVVQIGLTTGDGQLLLQGSVDAGNWAPPGGSVAPEQEWVEAARRSISTQTGTDVIIDGVVLLEKLIFELATDSGATFTNYGLSFTASLADDDTEFVSNPTIVEHPQLPKDHHQTFKWFEEVPDDANENHIGHIQRFLNEIDPD